VRERLRQTLVGLPGPQFEQVVWSCQPPGGAISGPSASQATRAEELLRWLESPEGHGLETLQGVLELLGPEAVWWTGVTGAMPNQQWSAPPHSISQPEVDRLVEVLLKCRHAIRDPSLSPIKNRLPESIRTTVKAGGNLREAVAELVDSSLAYPSGLEALLQAVRFYENGSYAYLELEALIRNLLRQPG